MKGKQLAFILVLLLLLGGAALYLRKQSSSSWSESATESNEKILAFPLNDVAHITIKSGSEELNLVRKEDGWRVTERADYPADFDKVSTLLRNLWELRATQDVKVGRSQLGRLQLIEPGSDPNSGTLIDLKGAGDKRVAALLIGKKQMQETNQILGGGGMPTGRYAMAPEKADRVFLISQTFEDVQTKPEMWINRDFISVPNPKSIAVVGDSPAINWKITREAAPGVWKLESAKPGEELDSSAAMNITSYVGSLGFMDVLAPDAPAAETGLDKPSIITFEDFDGFTYELRAGKLIGENYPVTVSVKADLPNERKAAPDEKPEDKGNLDQQFQARQKQLHEKLGKEQKLAGRAYLIPKAPIEQFLKERGALIKAPPPPVPAPAGSAPTSPAKSKPTASTSPAPKRPK